MQGRNPHAKTAERLQLTECNAWLDLDSYFGQTTRRRNWMSLGTRKWEGRCKRSSHIHAVPFRFNWVEFGVGLAAPNLGLRRMNDFDLEHLNVGTRRRVLEGFILWYEDSTSHSAAMPETGIEQACTVVSTVSCLTSSAIILKNS